MNKNKSHIYLIILLTVALLIGVGYAYLSSNLNILGNTTINKASWDIHFENLRITDGSVTATTPAKIDANKTTVNFGVTLTNPGDYYEFSVDEVNKGTIDAMVSSIVKTGVTEEQAKYLDYSVTYDSGAIVSEKQLLAAKQQETIKVRVEFKKDVTAADLPQTGTTLNLTFSVNYVQSDNSAVAIRSVCKRATTLHTETCNQSSNYCAGSGYAVGDTITYGNLGTAGTLTSGDAFDCDVNKDGVYDPATERFYYATDLDTNNSYAVLIYYNSVSGGEPNNTTAVMYNADSSSYLGPQTAMLQLPTTIQWPNVNLANTTRDIKDEKGTVKVERFSYTGYAARLITAQEVNSACKNNAVGSWRSGDLNKCQYLMENTSYANKDLKSGTYLESYISTATNSSVWVTNGPDQAIYGGSPDDEYDRYVIKPAIEVEKTKIKY